MDSTVFPCPLSCYPPALNVGYWQRITFGKKRATRVNPKCQMWAGFNRLPHCCSVPISICHDQLPPRPSVCMFWTQISFRLQYGSYFISFTNCLHLQPSSACFQVHGIVIRKSQWNRRFAPKQLRSSNYKTLGKCWADALHQYPHPPPFPPSNWESHLVSF